MLPTVPLPPGFVRHDGRDGFLVARADLADALLAAWRAAPVANPTLHGYAAADLERRAFEGRQAAYGITLRGTNTRVVVRHNRHGGALRAITGDLFFGATRAPKELAIAERLKAIGIPATRVVGYAVYAGPMAAFNRSDVVSEEIADSLDFGELLLRTEPDDDDRRRGWNVIARLLKRLATAGVRHHDLNVKNILLRRVDDGLFSAYLLDVDRVEFGSGRRDAYAANRARLRRSVEKWRATRGARITDAELARLRGTVPSMPGPSSPR